VDAFLEEMRTLDYVEGQHLVLEHRGAEGQYERFPALVAELVRLPVDVLQERRGGSQHPRDAREYIMSSA
jgi:hypothetical protein